MSIPSPIWLQIGLTAEKDLSNGEGWNWALLLRLNEQLSAADDDELSAASNFLRTPLTASSSIWVRGKILPLARHSELWLLSQRILWSQFLSQMWVSPVSLQRYMLAQMCSFSQLESHLWAEAGPSLPRMVDRKTTFAGAATTPVTPQTSIELLRNRQALYVNSPENFPFFKIFFFL